MTTDWVRVAVLVISAGVGVFVAFRIIANIHVVVPGSVFRSAQLSPRRLEALIRRHQIRSILNLRGASPGTPWYEREKEVAARTQIRLIDFELWSFREVDGTQAQALIEQMERAPKPMLIHCFGGADRTGLAAALYLLVIAKHEPEKAARALSVWFHHLWFTSAGAMDRSFKAFVASSRAESREGDNDRDNDGDNSPV